MSKFTDIFLPLLNRESDEEKRMNRDSNDNAIKQINQASWKPIEPILEQARILASDERERSKSAETKSAIYLAVLAAIVPLSAAIITDFSDLYSGWQLVILMSLFFFAMIYLAGALVWILKTLVVAGHDRVDVDELIRMEKNKYIEVKLCKAILKSVRYNRDLVNKKITNVKMAHEYLKRMLISFVLLLVLAGLMSIYPTLYEFFNPVMNC